MFMKICLPSFYVLLVLLLIRGDQASAQNIRNIYAFGDSYSDGGVDGALSSFNVTKSVMSSDTYSDDIRSEQASWLPASPESDYVAAGGGRWTNGQTAVENLAKALGATLRNYAIGGATTSRGNYCTWLDPYVATGILGQIDQFVSEESKIDSHTLFFIFASANDYFQAQDDHQAKYKSPIRSQEKLRELAKQSVSNIETAVRRLVRVGAQRFLIVNSSDLGIVPWEIFFDRTEDANFYTAYFNERIGLLTSVLEKEMGIKIVLFDHKEFTTELRKQASQHGIAELAEPCTFTQEVGKPASKSGICKDPNSYYFWDEWHPTAQVHRLVGQAMKARLVSLE